MYRMLILYVFSLTDFIWKYTVNHGLSSHLFFQKKNKRTTDDSKNAFGLFFIWLLFVEFFKRNPVVCKMLMILVTPPKSYVKKWRFWLTTKKLYEKCVTLDWFRLSVLHVCVYVFASVYLVCVCSRGLHENLKFLLDYCRRHFFSLCRYFSNAQNIRNHFDKPHKLNYCMHYEKPKRQLSIANIIRTV